MSENKKPRLAEVLGVEVEEKFNIQGHYYNPYFVDNEGVLVDGRYFAVDTSLSEIINHPELIKRCPRWTEQDVEIAKAVKLLAPAMDYIERIAENRSELYSKLDFGAAYLQIPCIPSMKVGERIALDDIIGGNT